NLAEGTRLPKYKGSIFKGGSMPAKSLSTLIGVALLISALPAWSQNQMPGRAAVQLPDGEGKETIQTACAACHNLNIVADSGHSPEEWKTTVAMMLNVGAGVPNDKVEVVTKKSH